MYSTHCVFIFYVFKIPAEVYKTKSHLFAMSLERNLSFKRRYFDSLIKKTRLSLFFVILNLRREGNGIFGKDLTKKLRLILAENDLKILVHISWNNFSFLTRRSFDIISLTKTRLKYRGKLSSSIFCRLLTLHSMALIYKQKKNNVKPIIGVIISIAGTNN